MPADVAFGEAHGEEVVLTDAAGNPWDEKRARPRIVFLSRLDCEVLCLEIPPVAERELAGLIRYRVRSLYPGRIENAAIDHVIQRRRRPGGGRAALVAVTEHRTLENYRRAAPKAAISVLAVALLSSSFSRRDGPVVTSAAHCVEVMRFQDGALVESTLIKRSRRETDAQKIARVLGAAAPQQPPLVIAPQAELEALAGELSAPAWTGPGGPAPQTRALESIDFPRRRTASLFPRRRYAGPRPALVRAALALLVVALAAGFFLRYLRFKESELAQLRTAVRGTQEADQAQASLGAQYDSLKARVQGLIRDRPVDAFQFLADLHAVLGPGVAVQDIVLQDGAFQLQALGPSPLSYMRRFLADSRFRDVRLLQTTPIPRSNRQRFVITGRYGQ